MSEGWLVPVYGEPPPPPPLLSLSPSLRLVVNLFLRVVLVPASDPLPTLDNFGIWKARNRAICNSAVFTVLAIRFHFVYSSFPIFRKGTEVARQRCSGVCARVVDPDPHGSAFIFSPGSGSRRVNLSTKN